MLKELVFLSLPLCYLVEILLTGGIVRHIAVIGSKVQKNLLNLGYVNNTWNSSFKLYSKVSLNFRSLERGREIAYYTGEVRGNHDTLYKIMKHGTSGFCTSKKKKNSSIFRILVFVSCELNNYCNLPLYLWSTSILTRNILLNNNFGSDEFKTICIIVLETYLIFLLE